MFENVKLTNGNMTYIFTYDRELAGYKYCQDYTFCGEEEWREISVRQAEYMMLNLIINNDFKVVKE